MRVLYTAQPTTASTLVPIRFEVTIMPVVTFVQSATDVDCEQFFIDNADVGNHHGHFTWSLTEAQFRDQFKSRGVSEQEIEDLLARARQGVPPSGAARSNNAQTRRGWGEPFG
jgi:hypothetical protein